MPYIDAGLPFAAGSHESWLAARVASLTRAQKTAAYLKLLYRRGPLTDPEVCAEMRWPRSSVCSIRAGVMTALLVERTGIVRQSEYGHACRAFYLTGSGIAAVRSMKEAENAA